MKSQTSQVARSCRIREWASMVQECRNRPNGMSVDEWCQANNITKANYYYRFAQVRKACLDSIPSNAVKHAIIPVPTELMHTEPESTGFLSGYICQRSDHSCYGANIELSS